MWSPEAAEAVVVGSRDGLDMRKHAMSPDDCVGADPCRPRLVPRGTCKPSSLPTEAIGVLFSSQEGAGLGILIGALSGVHKCGLNKYANVGPITQF